MKKKSFVILTLLALLVFTIYKMMMYEQSIREDHIITHYVEDESKPLIERISENEIREIVYDIDYRFKTGNTYFQIKPIEENNTKQWQNIFLKGVNLGVAVPGKFPTEFSLTFEQYVNWFEMIGKMNSNVIRIYTILPPGFYKALAYYNLRHQNKPLYIMHGVWAKVPEDENYFNTDYTRDFQKEIIDVIDVVHGKAVLKEKQGKAHGIYAVDVSNYIIGFLLGREWEPKSVSKTIKINKTSHYKGIFVSLPKGNPMEVWLAKMMDFAVRYETQTYHSQHPMSFVNWLPLDPMYHNTEFIENEKVREYDNDLVQIDFEKFNATEIYKSGIYAAYHVYPYYPDFIYLKKEYSNTVNHKGEKDNFFAYLQDLKQHTRGMPLVIAEYGLPSSRGISHFTPSGFNQGGHTEAKQAELSLTLTEDIFETDCAGAIYFEWTDEWFKHNWLVMDFEIPFNNRKLWHNMENPEQNFGILALENKKKIIDGNLNDWNNEQEIYQEKKVRIFADADPTYFYLSANITGFNFDKNNLYIAIDTYDKNKGDKKMPFSNKIFDYGFEFLCAFKSIDNAKLLVDEPYSVFTDIYNDNIPVYASKPNKNGTFIDELMLVNRGRETLFGEKTDSIINNRSSLVFGNSNKAETSNADWYWNNKTKKFELRLDWHLINVSDPSEKYVLDDKAATRVIEASQTDGFNIYFFVTDKKNNIVFQYPEYEPMFFTWDNWETPAYTERLKPIYDTLKNYFGSIKGDKDTIVFSNIEQEKFEIANYFEDRKAAISITFDNAGFSQYEYAFPLLNKYGLQADFSIIPELTENMPNVVNIDEGIKTKRIGYFQAKELIGKGNELAIQTVEEPINENNIFVPAINKELSVIHLKPHNNELEAENIFIRKHGNSKLKETIYSHNSINYSIINTNIDNREFDSILKTNTGKWNVFIYHHIYKDSTEIHHIKNETIEQYFMHFDKFRKQIRLARNTNFWIAPESKIYKYLYEKQHSEIEVERFDNLVFVKISNTLDPVGFNQELTIKYYTKSRFIKVTNSSTDGVYTNKKGYITFDLKPNETAKLEIIE